MAGFADVQNCIYADIVQWVGQKKSKIKLTYYKDGHKGNDSLT
jgi:hypothetical protein